jgi:hypothetical protein
MAEIRGWIQTSSTNDIGLTGSRKLAMVTGISFVSDDSATSDLNSW